MRELSAEEFAFISSGYGGGESGSSSLEHIVVYGQRIRKQEWWQNPISIGQYLQNNSPQDFAQYNQWYTQNYGSSFPSNTDPGDNLVVNGQDVNPDNMVLNDKDTREKFEELVENLLALDPNVTIKISGGDRYQDANGVVRSSTDHSIINAAPNGWHEYGKAVDFYVYSSVISNDQVRQAGLDVGFGGFKGDYADGHLHVTNRTP